MLWKKIVSWLPLGASIAAIVAAVLWFYASSIHVPTDLRVIEIRVDGSGIVAGVAEMSAAFHRQGYWNAFAAFASGLAVALQFLATVLEVAPG
jgi:hypothetical protein